VQLEAETTAAVPTAVSLELPKNSVGEIAKAQLRGSFWREAGRLI
jgi:hypothetical protein